MDDPICIIPARGGSKRLPGKNIAEVDGTTLLGHAIDAAQASGVFSEIVVSSDDAEIREVAASYDVTVHERPARLATDESTVFQVCHHVIDQIEERGRDVPSFGVLLTTNPLRTGRHVREAWNLFRKRDANYVVSLVPFDDPPQNALRTRDGYIEPFLDPEERGKSQTLEELYSHDGGVAFARTEAFREEGTYFGSKCVPYQIPRRESVDIDRPIDLAWARFLYDWNETAPEPNAGN